MKFKKTKPCSRKKGEFSYASYLHNKKLLPYNLSHKSLVKYCLRTNQQNLLFVLESRLDSVLYRIQFCRSFDQARQMITHKKVFVNGILISKPGFELKPGDIIKIQDNNNDFQMQNPCYLLFKKSKKNTTKRKRLRLWRKKRKKVTKMPNFIVKPMHLEVNYKLKTAIYLYSPQKLYFSNKLNIDLIRRSFRRTLL